jgi:DNA-binding XRE family transcriptional regulator
MSRTELADAVGVHYQTVGYLERGEYNPSLALALRIAAVLDRSVEELFSLRADHPNTDDRPKGQQ